MNYREWRMAIEGARVEAHFQPIFSSETGLLFGHEALGRLVGADGRAESLGPFFSSHAPIRSSSAERSRHEVFKRDVDRMIRFDAMERAAADVSAGFLFLNIAPSLILDHLERSDTALPYTILAARESGLDPNRVVLELTEEEIRTDPERLNSVIDLYRAEGFRIALDDVGSASSNLDRVALFKPDIIKIDFLLLKRSAGGSTSSEGYRRVIESLASLSSRLGADLLFEGIENADDFQNALSFGGRYLQGFLFARAGREFEESRARFELISRHRELYCFQRHGSALRRKREERLLVDSVSASGIDQAFAAVSAEADLAASLARKANAPGLEKLARAYTTDRAGIQLSSNYDFSRTGGFAVVSTDGGARGKCWCLRPYFFDHVEKDMNAPGSWTVSEPYRDIAFGRQMKTVARSVSDELVVFLDFFHEEES